MLIKGRAKFNFSKPEYLTDSDEEQDEESRRTKVKSNSKKKGKELYLLTDLRLEGKITCPWANNLKNLIRYSDYFWIDLKFLILTGIDTFSIFQILSYNEE